MLKLAHILTATTSLPRLEQLHLLAEEDDRIICLGTPGMDHPVLQRATVVESSFLWRRAAGKLASILEGTDVLLAWDLQAAKTASCVAEKQGSKVLAYPDLMEHARCLPALIAGTEAGKWNLAVPSSPDQERLVTQGIAPAHAFVLPACSQSADNDQQMRCSVRQELGLEDQHRLLVAPSPIYGSAGHRWAVWAMEMLCMVTDNLRIMIPGDGPARKAVQAFAATLGAKDDIFFTGNRFSQSQCIAAADIVLLLHESPGATATLPSAMAAGKPIVASNVPDLAWYAPDEECALLASVKDPRHTAAQVLRLLESPQEAEHLAKTAKNKARQDFCPTKIRERLLEICKSLP